MPRTTKPPSPPTAAPRRRHTTGPAISPAEFGRRVSDAMIAKDWSQADLARSSGIGPDSISSYINGRGYAKPAALTPHTNSIRPSGGQSGASVIAGASSAMPIASTPSAWP